MDTIFLTGSSGGLGSATRQFFLDKGWNVFGMDGRDDGFTHAQFLFNSIDSTDENSVGNAFAAGSSRFGIPSIFFATIGGLKPPSPHEMVSLEDFRFALNINIISTFICVKEATRLMKPEGRGTIITMGAETALRPEAGRSAYVSAKAAVIAFTQTIALETREYGVNTNCIVPTVIHTKANESWGSPEDIEKWTKPEDIAALCLFLASEPGRAINGSCLRIPNKM
ncbi:MAG: SDR family oxidoreductase [Ignavibacteriota bacterium]